MNGDIAVKRLGWTFSASLDMGRGISRGPERPRFRDVRVRRSLNFGPF